MNNLQITLSIDNPTIIKISNFHDNVLVKEDLLAKLPIELFKEVVSHLPQKDIFNIRQVNRYCEKYAFECIKNREALKIESLITILTPHFEKHPPLSARQIAVKLKDVRDVIEFESVMHEFQETIWGFLKKEGKELVVKHTLIFCKNLVKALFFVDRTLEEISRIYTYNSRAYLLHLEELALEEMKKKNYILAEKLAETLRQSSSGVYERLLREFMYMEPKRAPRYIRILYKKERELKYYRSFFYEKLAYKFMKTEPKKSLGFALILQTKQTRNSILNDIVEACCRLQDFQTAQKAIDKVSDPASKKSLQSFFDNCVPIYSDWLHARINRWQKY